MEVKLDVDWRLLECLVIDQLKVSAHIEVKLAGLFSLKVSEPQENIAFHFLPCGLHCPTLPLYMCHLLLVYLHFLVFACLPLVTSMSRSSLAC